MEAGYVTQFRQHGHQLDAHVEALRTLRDGLAQHVAGVAEAAVGDVDVGALQAIGAGRGQPDHSRIGDRRGSRGTDGRNGRQGLHDGQLELETGLHGLFPHRLRLPDLLRQRSAIRFALAPVTGQEQSAEQGQQAPDGQPAPADRRLRGGFGHRRLRRSLHGGGTRRHRRRSGLGLRSCGRVSLTPLHFGLQRLNLLVARFQRLLQGIQLLRHAVQAFVQLCALRGKPGQLGLHLGIRCRNRGRRCYLGGPGCHGRGDGRDSLRRRSRHLAASGQYQGLPYPQPVGIAADECLRVELVDVRHQLLVLRAAGAKPRGDPPQRIVAHGEVAPFARDGRFALHGGMERCRPLPDRLR
ncbi:hypothetical protein D3C76_426680 [compost metagenome]